CPSAFTPFSNSTTPSAYEGLFLNSAGGAFKIVKVVGVNIFCTDDEYKIDTFKYDKDSERRIKEALNNLKKDRNVNLVKEKLNQLKEVANSSENIMPIMIETVKTYATVQEICDVLRDVFGEYQAPQIF
ncbi:unnamed protein product, partial [marine sediment metagenome]